MDEEAHPSISSALCRTYPNLADIVRLREEAVHSTSVDRLDYLPTYEEFFQKYLLPNRPCIISAQCTSEWRSRKEWATQDGQPNLDFLAKHFGSASVPVADCSQEKFSSHPKQDMMLQNYLEYMKDHQMVRHGTPESMNEGSREHTYEKCLYLKDWHFHREFPSYKAYFTPVYFRSDWLNEFWESRDDTSDDYRFVYIGPKGTWTPFHADVFRSYSWSANICGRKKWIMFPPGQEKRLMDIYGQLVYDVTSPELEDSSKYPHYSNLQHKITIFQEQGEIIFVPSGWHHQVFNEKDTISINHNWLNGCNIDLCWEYVVQCLQDVCQEIADCRDMDGWHRQCQLILKASAGIDYPEFLRFLLTIARHRLTALQQTEEEGCVRDASIPKCPEENSHLPQHNILQNNLSQHSVPKHNLTKHVTPEHNTSKNNVCEANISEPNMPEHNMPEHNMPEHNTSEHMSEHNTSEHNIPEYNTPEHNISEHNMSEHNTSEHNMSEHNTSKPNIPEHNKSDHNTSEHNTLIHNTLEHNMTENLVVVSNICKKQWQTSMGPADGTSSVICNMLKSDTGRDVQDYAAQGGRVSGTDFPEFPADCVDLCPRGPHRYWRYCSRGHILFDLARVRDVFLEVLSTSVLEELDIPDLIEQTKDCLRHIDSVLKDIHSSDTG